MVLPALRSLPAEMRLAGVAHPRVHPIYAASGRFDALWPATGAWTPWRLRKTMRQWRPHGCLVFTQALSGRLLAWSSGAPTKVGWGSGWTRCLSRPQRDQPLWRSYVLLAETAGGRFNGEPDFSLSPGRPAQERAASLWGREHKVIGLAPGATYGAAKQWPYFQELQERVQAMGFKTAVFGGDAERSHEVLEQADFPLAGELSLVESIAAMKRCRVVVSNDSGAMHLGRCAGVPVVGLFGSTSPKWTGPTIKEGKALSLELDCSPCFKRECPLQGTARQACLNDLSVEHVMDSMKGVLEG